MSTLKNIDNNLPKLQNLIIKAQIDATSEGLTKMAYILSRLSRLETLKLWFNPGFDYKRIEDKIIKKCRKIKEIKIRSVSDTVGDNYQYFDFHEMYEILNNYGNEFDYWFDSESD